MIKVRVVFEADGSRAETTVELTRLLAALKIEEQGRTISNLLALVHWIDQECRPEESIDAEDR